MEPLFGSSPYSNPADLDPYAGELLTYQAQARIISQDLRTLPAADLWLWPTMSAAHVLACCSLTHCPTMAGCVHTPAASPSYPHGTIWWRHALLAARHAGVRLHLGAIEPEQRYEYLPLVPDGKFTLYPSFFEGIAPTAPRKAMKKIGFFGDQRREKGSSIIGKLAVGLLSKGYDVLVHDSSNRLGITPQPGLTILGFVEDLAAEVAQCDLVILPYNPEDYRFRGSGVLMDAIASGVPVVVPFGTGPGRMLDAAGAGTQFVRLEVPAILDAVDRAKADYPVLANAAYEAALAWRKRNSLAKFAQAFLPPI